MSLNFRHMAKLTKLFDQITITSNCCYGKNKKKSEKPSEQEQKSLPAQSSQPLAVGSEDTSKEVEQNVGIADDTVQNALLYAVPFKDSVYERQTQMGDELADFFKRPVEIFSYFWEVGVNFPNQEIFPWSRYLQNPFVIPKLDTFKLIHGTLRIKILVNGSPFHYGRLFAGVYPSQFINNTRSQLPDTSQTIGNYRNEFATGTMTWQPAKTFFSSRPHVFINPGKNDPALITWPFFAASDWIDVTRSDDFLRLGTLELWQLNPLRHASGGTTPVRLSILAWMEDVEVAGITTAAPAQSSDVKWSRLARIQRDPPPPLEKTIYPNPVLENTDDFIKEEVVVPEAQSSKPQRVTGAKRNKKREPTKVVSSSKKDEYGQNGAISAPLSAVANAAGYLVNVPVIGKFAKATEIGASAASRIAALFGFSKPPVISDIQFVNQQYYGNMATCLGSDNVLKLTIDPKQEITVDPGTVGLSGHDEMSFMNIAKREALIHTWVWAIEAEPTTASFGHIWACRVHPLASPLVSGNLNMTPVGFIAYPFRYWTGALRYRIQVVCSQMHSGRLLITYNPDSNQPAALGFPDLNARFSHIMDISQENDVTFEVNWAQAEAYREVALTYTNNDSVIYGPLGIQTIPDNARCNGRLDIYILNSLTAPALQPAEVNVYVSAGDSFRVNSPRGIGDSAWSATGGNFPLPSAESSEITRVALTSQEDSPGQNTHYVLNGDYDDGVNNLNDVYFGETIVSIRTMIKRYSIWAISPLMVPTTVGMFFTAGNILQIFPSGRGPAYGSSLIMPAGLGGTNNAFLTYLRYYCQGFVGFRGGVRWKTAVPGANRYWRYITARLDFKISSQTRFINEIGTGTSLGNVIQDNYQNQNTFLRDNTAGYTINAGNLGFGTLAEIPYQLPLRYSEIHEDVTNDVRYSGMYDAFHAGVMGTSFAAEDRVTSIEYHVAAAEDATFFFFCGVPAIKYVGQ